jgi:GT2 family glycosyltransferase
VSTPPASIVIPLRVQRDDWLEQSVRSALDQTVPGEVLVVTAPDTPPRNLEVLSRLAATAGPRLRIFDRGRPGFAVALNEGINAAQADRVALLFTDDWLAPEALEAALAEDADIVSGGKQIWVQHPDGSLEHVYQFSGTEAAFAKRQTNEERARYISHFLLLRRSVIQEAGGVDESLGDLGGVDDFDLIWTLLERGASVSFAEGATYRIRDHPGQRLTLRPVEEHLLSLNRILDKHNVPERSRAEIIAGHRAWFGRTIGDVLAEQRAAGLRS